MQGAGTLHSKGSSSVCIAECSFRLEGSPNASPQICIQGMPKYESGRVLSHLQGRIFYLSLIVAPIAPKMARTGVQLQAPGLSAQICEQGRVN